MKLTDFFNSKESVLSSDVKQWCEENPGNWVSIDLTRLYFSENVEFKPNPSVYYFVSHIKKPLVNSKGIFHVILKRDLKKSPKLSDDKEEIA